MFWDKFLLVQVAVGEIFDAPMVHEPQRIIFEIKTGDSLRLRGFAVFCLRYFGGCAGLRSHFFCICCAALAVRTARRARVYMIRADRASSVAVPSKRSPAQLFGGIIARKAPAFGNVRR